MSPGSAQREREYKRARAPSDRSDARGSIPPGMINKNMALVDYSESDSEPDPGTEPGSGAEGGKNAVDASHHHHPAKKRRVESVAGPAGVASSATAAGCSSSALPPLPAAFHDLYASTVRQSKGDDPSLHQGRKRQIPHVAGNWPSHVYVEWHPSPNEHSLLASLLRNLGMRLQANSTSTSPSSAPSLSSRAAAAVELSSLLSSDLGAPLPLHVSLSRPFALTTEQKDTFLASLVAGIEKTRVQPFVLRPTALEWHRTAESGRSFLVLRVGGRPSGGSGSGSNSRGGADDDPSSQPRQTKMEREQSASDPLPELLRQCNTTLASYKQPPLYAWADSESVGQAFHVSVGWSFAEPTEALRAATAAAWADLQSNVGGIEIKVDGVKAKIGNVVTHIPLRRRTRKQGESSSGSLFGI